MAIEHVLFMHDASDSELDYLQKDFDASQGTAWRRTCGARRPTVDLDNLEIQEPGNYNIRSTQEAQK